MLPVPPPKYVLTSAQVGTADWYPFRDPTQAPPDPELDRGEDDEDLSAEAPPAEEVEQEIRELVAGYNSLAEERDLEGVLGYYIEAQQETLRPVVEAAFALADKIPELAAALEAKLPERADDVGRVLSALRASAGPAISLKAVTAGDDDSANAELSGGVMGTRCRFLVIDDEWYIEFPDVAPAGAKAALAAALATCDGWLAALAADEPPAEEILAQIEAAEEALGR